MGSEKNIEQELYYNEDYFSRKNLFETLKKGGYVSEKKFNFNNNDWKIQFVLEKSKKTKGRVLDIGCGLGNFLASMPERFEKFGIDISGFAVEKARKKTKAKIIQTDISKQQPFKEKFDIITAFDTLEHIVNIESALKNISSSLKKDGWFFVEVPIKTRFHCALSKIKLGILDNDPTHVQKHKIEEWCALFEKEFKIVFQKKVFYKTYKIPGMGLCGLFVLKKKN